MTDEPRLICYDLPLRPGRKLARLILPEDLTVAEAERLAGIIRSIAFETTTKVAEAGGDSR